MPQPQTPRQDNAALIWQGGRLHGEFKNLRTRQSVLLIAAALKDPASATGITHVALGSGIGSGTLMLPSEPRPGATQLRQEQARFPISDVTYADLDNIEGDTITDGEVSNRIVYHIHVPATESEFLVTEVGLFGGEGAEQRNGGIMAAWITFPVIDNRPGGQDPDAPQDLTFSWRFHLPYVNPEELVPR